jgi:hypothetical protein
MYYRQATRQAQSNQATYKQVGEFTARNLAGCSFRPISNNIHVCPHTNMIHDGETQSNGRCSLSSLEKNLYTKHHLNEFRCGHGACVLVDVALTNQQIIDIDAAGFWVVPLDGSFYALEKQIDDILTALKLRSASYRLIGDE